MRVFLFLFSRQLVEWRDCTEYFWKGTATPKSLSWDSLRQPMRRARLETEQYRPHFRISLNEFSMRKMVVAKAVVSLAFSKRNVGKVRQKHSVYGSGETRMRRTPSRTSFFTSLLRSSEHKSIAADLAHHGVRLRGNRFFRRDDLVRNGRETCRAKWK